MNFEPTSNTTWVQPNQMPPDGIPCPKCNQGTLKESRFGGVWCFACRHSWKLSKFPPKETKQEEAPKEKDQEEIIIKGLREIYLKLNEIDKKLVLIKEVTDRFSSEEKIIIYPKNTNQTGVLEQSEPNL